MALSEGEVVRLLATRRETEEKRRFLHDSTYFSPSSFPNTAYPVQYLLLGSTLGAYEVNELNLTTALDMFPESIINTRSWKNIFDTPF